MLDDGFSEAPRVGQCGVDTNNGRRSTMCGTRDGAFGSEGLATKSGLGPGVGQSALGQREGLGDLTEHGVRTDSAVLEPQLPSAGRHRSWRCAACRNPGLEHSVCLPYGSDACVPGAGQSRSRVEHTIGQAR